MPSVAQQKVRTAARSAWGNVNSCKQVVPGVWEVDTWGHGGYLVAYPDFPLDPALRIGKFQGDSWTRGGIPVADFYQFEEDCDWAVLMHYHPEVAAAALDHERQLGGDHISEIIAQYEPEAIAEVVKRWNPDLLKQEAA